MKLNAFASLKCSKKASIIEKPSFHQRSPGNERVAVRIAVSRNRSQNLINAYELIVVKIEHRSRKQSHNSEVNKTVYWLLFAYFLE